MKLVVTMASGERFRVAGNLDAVARGISAAAGAGEQLMPLLHPAPPEPGKVKKVWVDPSRVESVLEEEL